MKANPRVADDQGKLAVERGPLVYCAEDKDNAGINLRHLLINPSGSMQLSDLDIQNTECKIPSSPARQFTVKALTVPVQEVFIQGDGSVGSKPVQLRLIPYYAWNHRGAASMMVWMANKLGGLGDY